MQLLLVDNVFEFYMGTQSLLQANAPPLLLLHVQQRCHAALNGEGQAAMAALCDSYLERAALLSKLSMFGGSDADVRSAARDLAVVLSEMQELLASPKLSMGDLQRLLSLNAAHFLGYEAMEHAVTALLVEQLQSCSRVQDVLDMWPQLLQQCSPRFIRFLLDPGFDVADDEIIPQPPARPPPPATEAESSDSGQSDDSATMQLHDLHAEQPPQEHAPDEGQQRLTYRHFVHSMSVLAKEQRQVLLAARSLMTRAGIAWRIQRELVYGAVEQMGKHIDVHTGHLELSNGRRSHAPFPARCPQPALYCLP